MPEATSCCIPAISVQVFNIGDHGDKCPAVNVFFQSTLFCFLLFLKGCLGVFLVLSYLRLLCEENFLGLRNAYWGRLLLGNWLPRSLHLFLRFWMLLFWSLRGKIMGEATKRSSTNVSSAHHPHRLCSFTTGRYYIILTGGVMVQTLQEKLSDDDWTSPDAGEADVGCCSDGR